MTFRQSLLASTIAAGGLLNAAPVLAQTAGSTQTAAAAEDDSTIVVTGTLIRNPNLVRSAPVTVTSSDEIELKQSNVAEEVLREIPGVVPNIGSAVNNGNGGASYVDLRGLGSFRNIVLLDGNRIAPSGLVGRVDLNNIPLALVERVDSLTGGASTTYGADAVSGVVNFITKQNFSGVDVSASQQITEKGDGNTFRTDATIGGNFDDDKGNVVFSVGYQQADPVYQGARAVSINNVDSFSGAVGGGSTTAVPASFSFQGGAPVGSATRVTGTQQLDPAIGAVRVPLAGTYAPFNFNPANIFQTPFERFNIYGQGSYHISDSLEIYTRGLFSKNTVNTIIASSGVFASLVTIPVSNPFLPAALRTQFCNNQDFNPALAGIQPLTAAQCAAAALATNPADPNYRTFDTTLRRRVTETGPRLSEFQTTIFDYRAGVRGTISDSINWDLGGAYGESENRQTLQGYVATSRVRQALLATNTATCLNNTNGCVPLNIFGPEGSITPAQAAFLQVESTTLTKTTLAQARGTVSGDFGWNAPWASDAISFAIGGEYRKYTAQQRSDILAKTAGELGGAGGAAPDITGGYNVREAFGELVVPLVQDKPFFESLTIEGGIRYSHYEVDAPGTPTYNTTTYKGGGSWAPGGGLKIRGNYTHAVRAPNISELFSPNNTVLTNLNADPCVGAAPVANANLRAVCLAQGAPAFAIGSIALPAAGQINTTTGGNINLKPETANTYTAGVVFQPAFVPGLSFTVDYYNIKVNGAVSNPTPGDAINACFGNSAGAGVTAASATDPNCTIIRRNPVTGALDGDPATTPGIFQGLSNLGTLKTDGVDLTANYSHDVGFAKLALSFVGNYTHDSKFKATPTSLNRECTGYYSVNCASIQPKFQWSQRTTLSFDPVDVSLLWRHIDSVDQEPDDIATGNGPAFQGVLTGVGAAQSPLIGQTVNFQHIKSYDYFDLSARVGVSDNLSLTVTVQNLLDKKPPLVGATVGSTSYDSGNTYPSTYDALGRRYAVTARLRF